MCLNLLTKEVLDTFYLFFFFFKKSGVTIICMACVQSPWIRCFASLWSNGMQMAKSYIYLLLVGYACPYHSFRNTLNFTALFPSFRYAFARSCHLRWQTGVGSELQYVHWACGWVSAMKLPDSLSSVLSRIAEFLALDMDSQKESFSPNQWPLQHFWAGWLFGWDCGQAYLCHNPNLDVWHLLGKRIMTACAQWRWFN